MTLGAAAWEAFQKLTLDSFLLDDTAFGEDELDNHLEVVEKALKEVQERLFIELEEHKVATQDEPSSSSNSNIVADGYDNPDPILSSLLAKEEYEAALARFLEISTTYWYHEGSGEDDDASADDDRNTMDDDDDSSQGDHEVDLGIRRGSIRRNKEALEPFRRRLWSHYQGLWNRLSSSSSTSSSGEEGSIGEQGEMASSPSSPPVPMHMLASLGLLPIKEALDVFATYKHRMMRERLAVMLNENLPSDESGGSGSGGMDGSISDTINTGGGGGGVTGGGTTSVVKNSSNAEILLAVREIDIIKSIVLAELRADASMLTTRAYDNNHELAPPVFSLPFDSESVVEVVEKAYMRILHDRIGGALARISVAGARAASTDDGAGAPKGLPMFLYDHEDGEVEVPCLGEEILVMKWDDGHHAAKEGGAIRWWLATVIESSNEHRSSLGRRRSSGSFNHQGPLLLLKDSGEKIHLRGSFFVRPFAGGSNNPSSDAVPGAGGANAMNTSGGGGGAQAGMMSSSTGGGGGALDTSSTTAAALGALGGATTPSSPGGNNNFSSIGAAASARKYTVGQRVLMQDEAGRGFYSEGVVVKIQSGGRGGTRYAVRLDGATAGNFVSGDYLLPGPAKVKIWHIWSAMLRTLSELPVKVQEALIGQVGLCPPYPSSMTVGSPRAVAVANLLAPSKVDGEKAGEEAKGNTSSIPQPVDPSDDQPWLEPLNLGLLLVDQGLGTDLSKAWVKPIADRIYDIHHNLLVYMSRIFAGQKLLVKLTSEGDGNPGVGLSGGNTGVAGGGGSTTPTAQQMGGGGGGGGGGTSTSGVASNTRSTSSLPSSGGGGQGKAGGIAHFQSQKAIKVIRPFFADLSHLLSLCVIGCSCIDGSTIEAGGFGGNNGSAEQVALTMLRGTTMKGGEGGGLGNTTSGGGTHGRTLSGMESRGSMCVTVGGGLLGTSIGDGAASSEDDDALRKLSGAFWSVIKAMTLEIKHFYHNLRVQFILPGILHTSDMPYCAEVLRLVVYLRGAWSHIMHRLELTMSRYQLNEHLANAFSSMLWRVTTMMDEMVSSLQARVVNLNLHWCKVYLLQDINVQDWQSSQPFMQDRRCTYGVLSWSLFMRGLFFDFRHALLHPSSAPETREIITAILAGSLSALTTRYLAIRPSRARLRQYIADVSCILVTSLTLALLLSDDAVFLSLRHASSSASSYLANNFNPSASGASLEGSSSGGGGASGGPRNAAGAFRDVLPIQSTPLESSLRPHDAAHQAALVNLGVVEKHCQALIYLLCLLRAPIDVLTRYLKAGIHGERRRSSSSSHHRRSSSMSSVGSNTGRVRGESVTSPGGGETGGRNTPSAAGLAATSPGGGAIGGAYNRLEDLILSIDIVKMAESLAASLEVNNGVFDVITESQKIGAYVCADDEMQTPDGGAGRVESDRRESGGKGGGVLGGISSSFSPTSRFVSSTGRQGTNMSSLSTGTAGGGRHSMSEAPPPLLPSYTVSHQDLAEIELNWHDILTNIHTFDDCFIPVLLVRRYELNEVSPYPPLNDEEMMKKQQLKDALEAHELYDDLMKNMEEVGGGLGQQECLPS